MDVLPQARKRELQYQHLSDGDAKKPGHFWSGLKSKLILYWQSVKNETPGRNSYCDQLPLLFRMSRLRAARKGAEVKEVLGFGGATGAG